MTNKACTSFQADKPTHFLITACRHSFMVSVVMALLFGTKVVTLCAQDQVGYLNSIGVPTYQTQLPVENGYVKVANGALHLEISLGSFPQRAGGQFKAALVYDSNIWSPGQLPINIPAANSDDNYGPLSLGGWRLITSADPGFVDEVVVDGPNCDVQRVYYTEYQWFQSYTYTEPDGTTHGFDIRPREGIDTPCNNGQGYNITNLGGYALDSSGFYIYSDSNFNITVRAPDGGLVYPHFEDSNGNTYTSTLRTSTFGQVYYGGGFPTSGTVTDSLGRPLLTVSSSGAVVYIKVLNSQGTTSTYTITTAQIPFASQLLGTNYVTAIQSIELPDLKSYSFLYDCDNGGSNPACGTQSLSADDAEIISMTLPTGGQIKYSYSINNFNGSYVNTSLHTRTTPDSGTPWTYALSWDPTTCSGGVLNSVLPTGCRQTLTVTKPSTDTEAYTITGEGYGGAWPTTAKFYNGASNLVATINQTFNVSNACVDNGIQACGSGPIYVTKTSQAVTLPTNVTQTSDFTWDGESNFGVYTNVSLYGQELQRQDWNFGNSSGTPDRTTTYTYWSATHSPYLTANILHSVASKTVTNSSGATVAQTEYSYDGSTLVSGALGTCPGVTGSSQHDDTNYGTGNTVRGNPTQVQELTSGSNYVTTSKTYDITGQVRTSTDGNLNTTTYCYADSFFNDAGDMSSPSSTSPPATNAYLTKITMPTVNSVTLTTTFGYYWGTGQKALTTDANNQTTYYHFYDPLNRPTSTEFPDHGWVYSAYPSENEVDTGTGITSTTLSTNCPASGNSCRGDQTLKDGLGRVAHQNLLSDISGEDSVDTTYDSNGRVYGVSNPHRTTSSPTDGTKYSFYDGLDRKIRLTMQDGSVAYTYYGTTVGSSGGLSSQLCSGYGTGYPILYVDEAGAKRQTWTDGFGRNIEADEPNASGTLSVPTCYSYDMNNNLTGVLQNGSRQRTFTYDSLSRLLCAANPEISIATCPNPDNGSYTAGTIRYGYDANSNPTTKTAPLENQTNLANTVTTTYSYDALNRLTQKSYSDGTPSPYFLYDQTNVWGASITNGMGRVALAGVNDVAGLITSYDPMGRVAEQWACIPLDCGALNYRTYFYNFDGGISSYTDAASANLPSVTFTQTPNGVNQVTQLTSSLAGAGYTANLATGITYWPTGQEMQVTYGNGLTEARVFNPRLQSCRLNVNSSGTGLSACASSIPSGNVQDFSYGLNPGSDNGNIASWVGTGNQGFNRTYTYDTLNRIATLSDSVTSNSCPGLSWSFDAWGNRLAQTLTAGSCGSWGASYNGSNQITNTNFQYDAAGNLTYDGTHHYTYDAENRLTQVDSGTTAKYQYDGNARRVDRATTSGTTDYVYDSAGNIIADVTGTNNTWNQEYIYLNGRSIAQYGSSTIYFVHRDHLGSARLMTNLSGCVVDSLDYLPYGELNSVGSIPCPPENTTHEFTSKERDGTISTETGLDNFGARYYSSQYGRFMTPDRLVDMHKEDPQSMNLYSYVRNRPLSSTDPSGNFDCKLTDSACGQSILADFKLREAASDINNPNMFALQKVSDAIGTYGDHNGLTIESGDLGAPGRDGSYQAAMTSADGKTITFNNNKDVHMDFDVFTTTLVHEGTHVMQDRQRLNSGLEFTGVIGSWLGRLGSSGPMSKNNLYRLEYEAYQNQGYMEEYLHVPGGIYDPTLKGEAETKHMQERVGAYAETDARVECSALPGCKQ